MLLFAAWAAENLYAAGIAKALSGLRLDAQEIGLAEVGTGDWRLSFLRERSTRVPDSSFLAIAALSYVRGAAHQVYKANEALNDDSLRALLNARSRIFEAANARFEARDTQGLIKIAEGLLGLESQTSGTFYPILKARQDVLQRKEQIGEGVASALYILGSIALGAAFLRGRLDTRREPDIDPSG